MAEAGAGAPRKRAARARKAPRAKATPERNVKVSFFRLQRRGRLGDQWTWPADGDVSAALASASIAREEANPEWGFVGYWGRNYYVEAFRTDPLPRQFIVSSVRTNALPMVLRAGARTGEPLSIDERDRLLEPTYVTLFEDRVAALVTGEHTPSHRQVAQALGLATLVDVDLLPIPRESILRTLRDGSGLSEFDFTIASGNINVAAEDRDPVRAAERLRRDTPGAERITVSMSASSAVDQRRLKRRGLDVVEKGLQGLDGAHARVVSDGAASEFINLMQADLAAKARIPVTARTRHLLPDEAYDATIQAHQLKKVEIDAAIALAADDHDSPTGPPSEDGPATDPDDADG